MDDREISRAREQAQKAMSQARLAQNAELRGEWQRVADAWMDWLRHAERNAPARKPLFVVDP